MKIKDRMILGVTAGLISGLPGLILNHIEYSRKLNDITYQQLAGTLLLKQKKVNTIDGKILGNLINCIGTSMVGLTTTYVLSATGRDYAALKGVGISALFGLLFGGTFSRIELIAKPRKPRTYTLQTIDHIIFGLLCGTLVAKLGDDRLFPDEQTGPQKIPLINTNTKPN